MISQQFHAAASGTPTWQQTHPAKVARLQRMIAASVLICEALIVGFAALIAMHTTTLPAGMLTLGTAAVMLGSLLLAGFMGRSWALKVGSLWQIVIVACSLVVPVIVGLALVFVALWVAGHVAVNRIAATSVPPGAPSATQGR